MKTIRAGMRRGFTLLEVMFSIVIATFATAAMYTIFTWQSQELMNQDLHMQMHQNIRFAGDILGRSLRLAGYNADGYVSGVFGPNGVDDEDDELPVIMSWDDPDGDDGPDAVSIVYGDPSLVMDTQNTVTEQCGTTSITFRPYAQDNQDRLAQYESDELLLCYDYADIRGTESYLFNISSDASLSTGVIGVESNISLNDYSQDCASSENLTPIMTCSKGHVLTFYVDNDDDGIGPGNEDHPVLMLDMDMDWPEDDDVPLVDNIEDLQFEYCLDDGTNTVDCTLDSSWVDEFDSDSAHMVWMVRISMIARSDREDIRDLFPGRRLGLANRSEAAASDTDHYFRKYMVTEVTVRNLRYQALL
jgi:prepilin-type N-terminal cleavage/methylation domain-containing protein